MEGPPLVNGYLCIAIYVVGAKNLLEAGKYQTVFEMAKGPAPFAYGYSDAENRTYL